jgi:hypothetical protein
MPCAYDYRRTPAQPRFPVRRARYQRRDYTTVALAIAALCGVTAFYCSEVIYSNIEDSGSPNLSAVPGWREHMAAGCIGAAVLMISLFLLEKVGGHSTGYAMRSVLHWLPLMAITGLAAVVHIPLYIVVASIVLYSPWAYGSMRRHAKSDRS